MPPFKPYVSRQQEKWAHTASGVAALGREDVEGKDEKSKGMSLPSYVHNGKPESGSLMAHHFRKARK